MRRLLSANPIISEIEAGNKTGIVDTAGKAADWLEIYNPDPQQAVSLYNWSLNYANSGATWNFPGTSTNHVTLGPGEYRVIFCDSASTTDPITELHTSFNLTKNGSSVTLYNGPNGPKGTGTAISSLTYPALNSDTSYGPAETVTETKLVAAGATASYFAPADNSLGTTWTLPGFNDTSWASGATGLGFANIVNGFATTLYTASAANTIGNLSTAESVTMPGNYISAISATENVLNFLDTGGNGHFGGDNAFPGMTINGLEHDNYVLQATGTITVTTAQAGYYTFGVNSDDGFSLTIGGANFSNGAGTTECSGDTMAYDGGRGASDSLGTTYLAAGSYPVSLLYFEGVGGAAMELYAAKENSPGVTSFDAANSHLVGDTANGGLKVTSAPFNGVASNTSQFAAAITTNVKSTVQSAGSTSLYTRIKFDASNYASLANLTLKMQYDDGYVAYLNGVKVASANAPNSPAWNSVASEEQTSDIQATTFQNVDLSTFLNSGTTGHITATGNVLAIQVLMSSAADGDLLVVPELSQMTSVIGGQHVFSTPTPGAANALGNAQPDISFSTRHGFFSTSFQVTLTPDVAGASIYYTTDNSVPSATHGTLYTGPIPITTTTDLRAVVVVNGTAGAPQTETYVFPAAVAAQPAAPAGFPTTWYGNVPNADGSANIESTPANYAMSSVPGYTTQQIVNALSSLPTMSLVTANDNLFGSSGIYSNSNNKNPALEVPGSLEYFDPNNASTDYGALVGLQMYGGYGRNVQFDKHSLAVLFDQNNGPSSMSYDIFGNGYKPDRLILRSAFNDGWAWGGANSQYIIDQWTRDALTALGTQNTPGVWVQLFVNGLYWGLYNAVAHIDNNYAASFYGGQPSDYDIIHVGSNFSTVSGDTVAWNTMYNIARTGVTSGGTASATALASPTAYALMAQYLNLPAFCDYIITNYYGSNWDWDWHNYTAIFSKTAGTGFIFNDWDGEGMLQDPYNDSNGNIIGRNTSGNPTELFVQLLANPDFRTMFADHIYRDLNGALSPTNAAAMYQKEATTVSQAIIDESARWGNITGTQYTPANWNSRLNWELGTYFPGRSATMFSEFQTAQTFTAPAGAGSSDQSSVTYTMYPNFAPPTLSVNNTVENGGTISLGDVLTMAATGGSIYYTTDGSDPRSGGTIFKVSGITLNGTTATVTLSGVYTSLYNGEQILLGGAAQSAYNGGFVIANLTSNPTAKTTTFTCTVNGSPASPATPLAGESLFATTVGTTGISPTAILYSGPITFTSGMEVKARVYLNGAWSALNDASFNVNLAPSIRITELMYNPMAATTAEVNAGYHDTGNGAQDFEFVELQNIGTTTVPLQGLTFTNGVTFTFPAVSLAAGAYIIVCSDPAAFAIRYGSTILQNVYGSNWATLAGYTGHFNNGGERVTLGSPNGGVIQDFSYSNSWYPQTDGGGFSLVARSTSQALSLWGSSSGWKPSGTPNGNPGTAETVAIPLPDSIIVNEVMSHTSVAPGDMIEFYNTTSQPIDIGGWYVSDSSSNLMKYQIAAGTTIAANGYFVLTEDYNFGTLATDPGRLVAFGLNEHGDDVYLSNNYASQPGGYREHQTIDSELNGLSRGLYTKSTGGTDFTLLQTPTFGTHTGNTWSGGPNSIPYVAPLVTDEIMYNPSAPTTAETNAGYTHSDFEYVELYNRSSSPVALNNYYVAGGIGYSSGWLADGNLAGNPTVSSITLSGTTATVTLGTASSGFQNGDRIHIDGAAQIQYNGDFVIGNVAVNGGTTTFTYTVSGSPTSPATPAAGQLLTAGRDNELQTLESGATATWSASSVAPASYNIYAHLNLYNGDNNLRTDMDSLAQYTVTCAGIATNVVINQNQVPAMFSVTSLTYNTSGLVTAYANNSLSAGSIIHISGASQSQYNGTFVVQSATTNSFTYALAAGLSLTTATGAIMAGLNDVWINLGTFAITSALSVQLTRTTSAKPSEWTVADSLKLVTGQQTIVLDRPTLSSYSMQHPVATLAPGAYAVLVSNYAAFDERNHVAANNILVLGAYSGHLNNGGDSVDLYQIGNRDDGTIAAMNGYLPSYRVDHVNFNNAIPWPLEPDGNGPALVRVHTADYGNDAFNWEAGNFGGTPGTSNLFLDKTPPSTPANLAGQALLTPSSEISLTWTASADPLGSFHYAIYRSGSLLGTSTTNSFVDTSVASGTNYTYAVMAVNRDGYASPQSNSIVIGLPAVVTYDWLDNKTLEIYFSEPLTSATAGALSHYAISNGISFSAVALSRGNTKVTLTTLQAATTGSAYTVTMTGLATSSGDQLPASLPLSMTCQPPTGKIMLQVWNDLDGGTSIGDLTSPALNSNYPNNPTNTTYLTSFDAPYNTGMSNYGERARGYLYPPTTGNYVFWIASDDNSQLWLSTNDNPANVAEIAHVDSWTSYEAWTTYATQQSASIPLVAGQRYYIEALMKQGTGGDNLSVAWMLLPSGGTSVPDASKSVPVQPSSSFSITTLTHNGTIATATLSATPGFMVGQSVQISGVTGSYASYYNGTFAITGVNGSTFTFTIASGAPIGSATGTKSVKPYSISYNGSTAIVWLPSHGYTSITRINVTGATPSTYNGFYQVTYVNANVFTYSMSSTPTTWDSSMTTVQQCGITYIGTTATVWLANSYSNGDWINITGATPSTYNGLYQISNVSATSFDYTMASTPTAVASGTILVNKITFSQTVIPGANLAPWGGNTLDLTAPVAPANLKAVVSGSNNQITLTWSPVLEPTSGIDHYVIYRDGSLYDTSTTASYTDTNLSSPPQHLYQVTAVNFDGAEGTKSLTVTAAPIGIVSIKTPTTTTVNIQFSEPVDPVAAGTLANYSISGGVTISAAVLQSDGYTVILTTSVLSASYALTVSNVKTLTGSALSIPLPTNFTYTSVAWAATFYQANWGTLGSLANAQSVVNTPNSQIWSQVFSPATINFTAGSTALGHFINDGFMPNQTALTTEWDNYVITATGTIYIPSSGYYTFDVTSDDGFSLTIPGATFMLTGATNANGSNSMAYDGGRGTSDTFGVTYLNVGYYPISLLFFQGGGPSSVEVAAAAGSFTAWDSSFRLIGDTADGGLSLGTAYHAPPFSVAVDSLQTGDSSPALTGKISDSAASVTVRVNNNYYAATNNGNGTWSLPRGIISPALVTGTYDVVAIGVNTSGIAAFDSTINELVVAINTTTPTVGITAPTSPTPSPINSINIQFSEPIQDFTTQNLQLTLNNGGATASEPLEGASLTTTDNRNWILGNLTGLTAAAGTYTLTLSGLGPTITDNASNPLLSGATATWIMTNPAVASINRTGSSSFTNAPSVSYFVTFNKSVTNVQATNFTLVAATGVTGSIASVTGSGSVYTVTVNGVSGNGTLGLNLVDDNSILDLYNNPLGGPNLGDGNFAGQAYTIDMTAPTIAIGSPSAAYTAGGPITYTVTYADANFATSTLTMADITLKKTGTAYGTVSVSSGSGLTRTVTISGITGDGSLGISIGASTASDLAGNQAPAAGPTTTFTVDNTAPTIAIGGPSAAYTAGGPISYTVTYADANFNASTLALADINLIKTGTANGTVSVSPGSGLTRTITISSITGDGTLGISIGALTASDLAGNQTPATGPSTTFTVNNTVVAVAAAAKPNPANGITTELSVLGADPSTDEASLTYSWTATMLPDGATLPAFSPNKTNSAKNSTATFSKAGTYELTATVTDPVGLMAASSVSVTVNQTLTTISLAGQPLQATAFDQFGNALTDQPTFDASSDTITSPLTLANNVTLLPAAGSSLTISGAISGTGQSLSVNGPGTVVLSGINHYTGGTIVSAGTLVIAIPSAIADGTSLTVGADASQIFGSSFASGTSTVVAATNANSTDTLVMANNLSAVTSMDTQAITALPLAASPVAAGVLPAAVTTIGVNHGRAGGIPQTTVGPSSFLHPRQFNIAGTLPGPAAKRLASQSTVKRIVSDLAWLGQVSGSSDNSEQHHKKDAAILALETVFAQYDR